MQFLLNLVYLQVSCRLSSGVMVGLNRVGGMQINLSKPSGYRFHIKCLNLHFIRRDWLSNPKRKTGTRKIRKEFLLNERGVKLQVLSNKKLLHAWLRIINSCILMLISASIRVLPETEMHAGR